MQRLAPYLRILRIASLFLLCCVFSGAGGLHAQTAPTTAPTTAPAAAPLSYHDVLAESKAVARWTFNEPSAAAWQAVQLLGGRRGNGTERLQHSGKVHGKISRDLPGPVSPRFPGFPKENLCLWLDGQASLRFDDLGDESLFDFGIDDEISIEAWVAPSSVPLGNQVYIVGKGRTGNSGFAADNQNWALRLRNVDGMLKVSFLYRAAGETGERFHRWNSAAGILPDSGWHHVVFTYRFADVTSAVAYIDGERSLGSWDMGGDVAERPVVDNDQIWVGSSMKGNRSASFAGGIDEIALYRHRLSADDVRLRYRATPAPPRVVVDWEDVPRDQFLIRQLAPIPDSSWNDLAAKEKARFTLPTLAVARLPRHYDAHGQLDEPPAISLVRAAAVQEFPAGNYRFVVRAKNAARLYIDGKLIGEQAFMSRNSSGHEEVPDLPPSVGEHLPPVPAGHREFIAEVSLDAGLHRIRLDTIVGGKGLRAELGDLFLGVAPLDSSERFYLVTPGGTSWSRVLDRVGWLQATAEADRHLSAHERRLRQQRAAKFDPFWEERHAEAKAWLASSPLSNSMSEEPLQRLNELLSEPVSSSEPAPPLDDLAFLRRLALDTVGVVPSRTEIENYLKQPNDRRRQWAIDQYLADPRWADHWVAYWQDVLAENPGILKPKLNNTGPFRWWIHESFLDNKPYDRLVTELIMMEGGGYAGGPAGFQMATQNDVPMAAKAHVLSQAFLGVEMKCARCHDAPFHPFRQNDLFEIAAMLQRDGIKLPATSSVPRRPDGRQPAVDSSLTPGDTVTPKWPFSSLVAVSTANRWVDDPADPREKLAGLITSPDNIRFARVGVNRLWHRYLGWGFVEPIDDWTDREPVQPEVLDLLAVELIRHDYDLKHVARLIFQSDIYHRSPVPNQVDLDRSQLKRPLRRRMTAEQIVDSLYVISGKSMDSEALTLDPEGRRAATTFLNLGTPTRAWQLTSLSNERDRPALALPVAQSIVDVLLAYGWRDARPNPISVRDETPTVLQPMVLANGIVGNRACRLSDNSRVTELCHQVSTPRELTEELFLRILSRRPHDAEARPFVDLLESEFDARKVSPFRFDPFVSVQYSAVSWSNHLSAAATRIKQELERKAREGDPPSDSLAKDWRERAEDAVWALLNTPEFVFIP